jgi:ribokinase
VQLELDAAVTLAAMKVAKEEGCTVILNTAPAQAAAALPAEIFGLCDVLCPNEPELGLLSGKPVDTVEQIEAAAKFMVAERKVKCVLVTMGERGSLLVEPSAGGDGTDGKFDVTHAPCDKVAVVDSVGAGDCFLGAFVYYMSRGVPMREAMPLAGSVASISVMKKGTQTSYPARADLPERLQL